MRAECSDSELRCGSAFFWTLADRRRHTGAVRIMLAGAYDPWPAYSRRSRANLAPTQSTRFDNVVRTRCRKSTLETSVRAWVADAAVLPRSVGLGKCRPTGGEALA